MPLSPVKHRLSLIRDSLIGTFANLGSRDMPRIIPSGQDVIPVHGRCAFAVRHVRILTVAGKYDGNGPEEKVVSARAELSFKQHRQRTGQSLEIQPVWRTSASRSAICSHNSHSCVDGFDVFAPMVSEFPEHNVREYFMHTERLQDAPSMGLGREL